MRRYLMAILAALTATAFASCAARPAPEIRTVTVWPFIPPSAKQPCRRPVDLPDAAMTAQEVAAAMARDRSALLDCEDKRSAAVAAATPPIED